MSMMVSRKTFVILIVAVSGFVLDRWFKYLALHEVTFGPVDGGVRFELFPNPAIAFSLAVPSAWTMWLIPPVLLGIVWLALRWWRRGEADRAAAALLVVVASASNYLDRLQRGYVVDYVSVGDWFPVFNLADILIVIGLGLIIFRSRVDSRQPVA